MKKFFIILSILILGFGIVCFHNSSHKDTCSNKNYSKEYVSFNTKSYVYHDLNCECAQRCTVNCITITRDEAIERGGRPCHRCNGGD